MNWNDIASIQLPSPQTEALLKKKKSARNYLWWESINTPMQCDWVTEPEDAEAAVQGFYTRDQGTPLGRLKGKSLLLLSSPKHLIKHQQAAELRDKTQLSL